MHALLTAWTQHAPNFIAHPAPNRAGNKVGTFWTRPEKPYPEPLKLGTAFRISVLRAMSMPTNTSDDVLSAPANIHDPTTTATTTATTTTEMLRRPEAAPWHAKGQTRQAQRRGRGRCCSIWCALRHGLSCLFVSTPTMQDFRFSRAA